MKIVKSISQLRTIITNKKKASQTIGYVPTMGYLHDGHLSLMENARKDNDVVVISIFVNPTQFGPEEDLESYPRDLKRDAVLAESKGVDIIFTPSVEEMYSDDYSTYVEVTGEMTNKLCGASRDGHFRGVTSVVSKLFNIVTPDKAYFGQKDYQQLAVIKKMVKDLNFNIEIIGCPIVREADGLAMSSRNTYLSEKERQDALILNRSLKEAEAMIISGERNPLKIKEYIIERIKIVDYAEIDYVEVVDAQTLASLEEIASDVLIALAVKVGKPRLIDNIVVEV